MNSSDQEVLDIHAELLKISNQNESQSRFMKKMTPVATGETKSGGEITSDSNTRKERDYSNAEQFLKEAPENGHFNQYWYSLHTIETIRKCISEVFESRGIKEVRRVAFLSTPSIYFSLPEEKRTHCKLFDVRFFSNCI